MSSDGSLGSSWGKRDGRTLRLAHAMERKLLTGDKLIEKAEEKANKYYGIMGNDFLRIDHDSYIPAFVESYANVQVINEEDGTYRFKPVFDEGIQYPEYGRENT